MNEYIGLLGIFNYSRVFLQSFLKLITFIIYTLVHNTCIHITTLRTRFNYKTTKEHRLRSISTLSVQWDIKMKN